MKIDLQHTFWLLNSYQFLDVYLATPISDGASASLADGPQISSPPPHHPAHLISPLRPFDSCWPTTRTRLRAIEEEEATAQALSDSNPEESESSDDSTSMDSDSDSDVSLATASLRSERRERSAAQGLLCGYRGSRAIAAAVHFLLLRSPVMITS